LKRYLGYSILLHTLLFGVVLVGKLNTERTVQPRVYYEIEVTDPSNKSGFWANTGKKIRSFFAKKTAYELFKNLDRDLAGDRPALSDKAEVEKEVADDAARPSHMKKQVLYKNYIDMVGESAMIPWFREVEKVVRLRRAFHDRTFETTAIVVLNKSGEVVKVVIARSSGDELMDAAVKQAFVGQAYPRPPKSLIDKDGFGRIKWAFEMYLNLDLAKKGKFRISRRD
jgi:hypothetical protein